MKKRIFYIAVVLWIVAAIQIGVRYNYGKEDKIVEAFSNVDFVKTHIGYPTLYRLPIMLFQHHPKEVQEFRLLINGFVLKTHFLLMTIQFF